MDYAVDIPFIFSHFCDNLACNPLTNTFCVCEDFVMTPPDKNKASHVSD